MEKNFFLKEGTKWRLWLAVVSPEGKSRKRGQMSYISVLLWCPMFSVGDNLWRCGSVFLPMALARFLECIWSWSASSNDIMNKVLLAMAKKSKNWSGQLYYDSTQKWFPKMRIYLLLWLIMLPRAKSHRKPDRFLQTLLLCQNKLGCSSALCMQLIYCFIVTPLPSWMSDLFIF